MRCLNLNNSNNVQRQSVILQEIKINETGRLSPTSNKEIAEATI